MSLNVTLYPDESSEFRPRGHVHPNGDTYCTVDVDGASIQTNSWQAMQRLAEALTTAIAQAKVSEQDHDLAELVSA